MNRILPFKLLTLLVLLGMSLTATAYDFTYYNTCYTILDAQARTVEVSQRPTKYSGNWTVHANPVYNGVTYTTVAIGDSAFYNCTGLTSITLPNTVTRIGTSAFRNCTGLTQFTIPSSVTNLGHYSLSSCERLKNVSVPNSVTTMGNGVFYSCDSLNTVTWSNQMTTIPTYTFYECTQLSNFKIPHWIKSIGYCALCNTNLSQIIVPYGVTSIGDKAFAHSSQLTTLLIPSSVTSIGSSALDYCTGLTEIYCNMATPTTATLTNVPSTCKIYVPVGKVGQYKAASGWSGRSSYINAGAFDFNYGSSGYDPNNVYHMTITSTTPVTYNGTTYDGTAKYVFHPKIQTATGFTPTLIETDNMCGSGKKYLITEIGDSAFCWMGSSIKSINFKACEKLEKIGKYAFYKAQGMTSIELPSNLKTIDKYAFWHCEKLPSIVIPNSVNSMGTDVFNNCSALTSVTWGTGMKSIPAYAFYYCTKLATFKFPYWITSIGMGAFQGCGLEQAILPYGLKSISTNAFRSSSIKTLLIPSSVTSMESSAFMNCQNLNEVYCNMATPVSIDVTDLPSTAKFYVPVGKVGQYKATSGWSSRSSYVRAGAFDFNLGNDYNNTATYHMTVTSATPVTYEGVRYDGTAKYVFHPNIITTTLTYIQGNLAESDNMCGSGKMYLMTEVGDSCFNHMSQSVTGVTLEECAKMTKLGKHSFCYAQGLKGITLPNNLTTIEELSFLGCPELASITLPNSLTKIRSQAFYGCSKLTSIAIPNSVTDMGSYVFQGCSTLSSVTWSKGLTGFPAYTFKNCPKLTTFKMPYWITFIGTEAFENSGLKQAILPYGLKDIYSNAFKGCTSLETVLIPGSVTSVNKTAFDGCSGLKTIYCNIKTPPAMDFTGVPGNYTVKAYVPVGQAQRYASADGWRSLKILVGAYDFNYGSGYNAESLYHMNVISTTPVTYDGITYDGTAKYVYHPNVETTNSTGFGCALYETDNMCGSDKKYLITEIGDSCFYHSSAKMADISFLSCAKLTKIGRNAFYNCRIKTLKLPASVTTYDTYALYFMPEMTDLYVENPTPVSVPQYTFQSADQARTTLHVPTQAAVTAYKKATYWKNFYKIVTDAAGTQGDVNDDGVVDPSDITALIDYLLTGKPVNLTNADCDQNGEVDPSDIATLIGYLLNDHWPNSLMAPARAEEAPAKCKAELPVQAPKGFLADKDMPEKVAPAEEPKATAVVLQDDKAVK